MVDSILLLSTKYWVIAGLTRNLLVTRTLHELQPAMSESESRGFLCGSGQVTCCGVFVMSCAGYALAVLSRNRTNVAAVSFMRTITLR